MTVDGGVVARILVEVMTGKVPDPPDSTPEMATVRQDLRREVDAIRNLGGIVEIPPDIE